MAQRKTKAKTSPDSKDKEQHPLITHLNKIHKPSRAAMYNKGLSDGLIFGFFLAIAGIGVGFVLADKKMHGM